MGKLYTTLARLVNARATCAKNGNFEWRDRHEERILALVKNYLPSGSGFDNGTTIELDSSTDEKLVFATAFHHMDENGFYDGWSEHIVIVRPSLVFGIRISIGGRDRNEIKDYVHECFSTALTQNMDPAIEY